MIWQILSEVTVEFIAAMIPVILTVVIYLTFKPKTQEK